MKKETLAYKNIGKDVTVNFIVTLSNRKSHPFKLYFPAKINYLLKKHCNYATFVFIYKTEDEAYRDGHNVLKELTRATGREYIQFEVNTFLEGDYVIVNAPDKDIVNEKLVVSWISKHRDFVKTKEYPGVKFPIEQVTTAY